MIQEQLSAGERLLWSGQPRSGLMLRTEDLFLVPFSLLWGGFAIFWEVSAFGSEGPFFFKLWGVPFVLIGLYLIVGRFFWDAFVRSRTSYGLSDQRVIILATPFGKKLTTLSLRALPEITLAERADGSGTIQFGRATPGVSRLSGTAWPGIEPPPSFEAIENAKHVYELIRQAQQKER